MASERDVLRDWHRLFGLLLTDMFTGSPFVVEVERDLSAQQQLIDVIILRRGRGRFTGQLPDGLEQLAEHNLITFKSHREALDAWAMKELVGHYVAYRELVSDSPSALLPEERFRLYAVCARFPHNLSSQVPWQERQAGVYDCRWATDVVRVVVAGELPREERNAPLHLFSASAELVGFGRGAYRQHSEHTSRLLRQLLESYQEEGLGMPFTLADFDRWYIRSHFSQLTLQEQQEVFQTLPPERQQGLLQTLPPERQQELLQTLPPERQQELLQTLPLEKRLAGLSPAQVLASLSEEQIREYLERRSAERPSKPRKPRRKSSTPQRNRPDEG
jgi:hypothetical protein